MPFMAPPRASKADFQQNQFWGLLCLRHSKPQNWFHNENYWVRSTEIIHGSGIFFHPKFMSFEIDIDTVDQSYSLHNSMLVATILSLCHLYLSGMAFV